MCVAKLIYQFIYLNKCNKYNLNVTRKQDKENNSERCKLSAVFL